MTFYFVVVSTVLMPIYGSWLPVVQSIEEARRGRQRFVCLFGEGVDDNVYAFIKSSFHSDSQYEIIHVSDLTVFVGVSTGDRFAGVPPEYLQYTALTPTPTNNA